MTNNNQVKVECPHCDQSFLCGIEHTGTRSRCPHCGHEFRIPRIVPMPEAPPISDDYRSAEQSRAPFGTFEIDLRDSERRKAAKRTSNLFLGWFQKPNMTRTDRVIRVVMAIYIACTILWIAITPLQILLDQESRSMEESVYHCILGIVFMPPFFTALLTFYVFPSLIAYIREHQNFVPLLIVNLAFGLFGGIGWIAALAWAFSSHVAETRTTVKNVNVQ